MMAERKKALARERKRRQREKGREYENCDLKRRRRGEPPEVRERRLTSLRSHTSSRREDESKSILLAAPRVKYTMCTSSYYSVCDNKS